MIIYKLYRDGQTDSITKSCYLPTVQGKIMELLSEEFRSVLMSENGKTISLVDHKGNQTRLLIVTPNGDSDTILYMDYDTADEVFRIDKENLR